jgi:hypothetical protein
MALVWSSIDIFLERLIAPPKDRGSALEGQVRTECVSIFLEVVQESLAHAFRAPFVLLIDKRHVCGLRVAVEGYARCSRATEASCAASKDGELLESRMSGKDAAGWSHGKSASSPWVTQRGSCSRGCAR